LVVAVLLCVSVDDLAQKSHRPRHREH